jgi:hypothetical protein
MRDDGASHLHRTDDVDFEALTPQRKVIVNLKQWDPVRTIALSRDVDQDVYTTKCLYRPRESGAAI